MYKEDIKFEKITLPIIKTGMNFQDIDVRKAIVEGPSAIELWEEALEEALRVFKEYKNKEYKNQKSRSIKNTKTISNREFHGTIGKKKYWWLRDDDGFVDLNNYEVDGVRLEGSYRGDRDITIKGLPSGNYTLGCGTSVREKFTISPEQTETK